MSKDSGKGLQLLFQRPFEPAFTPRDNGKTAFQLPESYYTDRYKGIASDLSTRFGGDGVEDRINIREIQKPDLTYANVVPKDKGFSVFVEKHRIAAGKLTSYFLQQPDYDSFISAAAYVKDRVNPYLFQYALAVAAAHRTDTKDIPTPSIVQVFPDRFVDPSTLPKMREESTLVPPEDRRPIDIPQNYTASDREQEQRLAYFREDIGINAHHWHWHLVYPGSGDAAVVNKDRRGELFYYMHSQIQARYNVERFAHRLPRVKALNNFRDVLTEGYFPKMVRSLNNRAYPPRVDNSVLQDVDRDEAQYEVADLERWRDRIFEAIDAKSIVMPNGTRVPLTEPTAIDIIGDVLEASDKTPNRQLYGDLHNQGHNLLSFIHDPDNRHLEDFGVIGENTTAMRDPAFYRWHGFIDNIFVRYKMSLPQYPDNELVFDGVAVQSIGIRLNRKDSPQNLLLTFWQRSQVDLGAGLDFGPQGNVLAQFTHLQHAPFSYTITVNNTSGAARRGTCRIFITPRVDERGTTLSFREQRRLMIEMDKFTVNLTPGSNQINRRSDESSLTIPFERTFRMVGLNAQPTNPADLARFQFCGCGWPQHMLVPKGTPEGMQFELFVMISNFADDTVNQEYDPRSGCNEAASFCGVRDQLYPDRRPMGYPFDRNDPSVTTLSQFVGKGTNMAMTPISIRFSNSLVNRT